MKEYTKYIIKKKSTVKDALIQLNNLSGDIQTLFVLDDSNKLLGTLTDGDIRRGLISGTELSDKIDKVFETGFRFVYKDKENVHEIKKFREQGVSLLPCLDDTNTLVEVYNLKERRNILPIDAILMAGGKGMRLRPLTENIPKPLLNVGDKPIIDYNIDNLIKYGIKNIHITVNYLGDQIIDHFKEAKDGIRINCIREPEFLGTMGSVKFVKGLEHDYTLVMNSDLFTNIDYEDFLNYFLLNDADMAVAAVPYSVNIPYGIFDLDGGNVKSVLEKPSYNYYVNAGIYIFKSELLKLIPDNTFYDATDFIKTLIKNKYSVVRYPLIGYWIDIGKHEDYNKVQDIARHLEHRKTIL